jgi:hypothetical protein
MTDLEPRQMLWMAAGAFLLLALVAAFANHRRKRRRDIDKPGLMPWQAIEFFSFFLAILAAAVALNVK